MGTKVALNPVEELVLIFGISTKPHPFLITLASVTCPNSFTISSVSTPKFGLTINLSPGL